MLRDKKPSLIGRMFDTIAPTYDRLNTILSFSIDKAWRKAVIQSLEIHPGDLILDIATGTGDLALLAAYRGGKVIGIDLSMQMLLRAILKARERGFGTAYMLVRGNALMMPFRDETFNRAMVAYGIRNMENVEVFLDEIYRVLKRNGRFSVLEFSMPEKFLFRWIYLAYLTYVLPCIGFFLSGNYEAYRYLRNSVMRFPTPKNLEGIMEARGFHILQSKTLSGGICHLYLLEKH